jgi:hypothetical protein
LLAFIGVYARCTHGSLALYNRVSSNLLMHILIASQKDSATVVFFPSSGVTKALLHKCIWLVEPRPGVLSINSAALVSHLAVATNDILSSYATSANMDFAHKALFLSFVKGTCLEKYLRRFWNL